MRKPPPQPSPEPPRQSATPLVRASIFVMDPDEDASPDYQWAIAWFESWGAQVRVADYSSGGFEHLWDVEGPADVIAEIPERLRAITSWSQKPYPPVKERNDRRHGRR